MKSQIVLKIFLHIKQFLPKFKACVHYFLSNFCFSPNDSPLKTMKNVFYFIVQEPATGIFIPFLIKGLTT